MGYFVSGKLLPNVPAAGSGGIGPGLSFASPAGVINPTIAGFIAGAGTGTGRLYVTLSGNTSWESLPAGADGQQLYVIVVAGAFTLTLVHLSASATHAKIYQAGDFAYGLNETAQLFFDSTLGDWVLVA